MSEKRLSNRKRLGLFYYGQLVFFLFVIGVALKLTGHLDLLPSASLLFGVPYQISRILSLLAQRLRLAKNEEGPLEAAGKRVMVMLPMYMALGQTALIGIMVQAKDTPIIGMGVLIVSLMLHYHFSDLYDGWLSALEKNDALAEEAIEKAKKDQPKSLRLELDEGQDFAISEYHQLTDDQEKRIKTK